MNQEEKQLQVLVYQQQPRQRFQAKVTSNMEADSARDSTDIDIPEEEYVTIAMGDKDVMTEKELPLKSLNKDAELLQRRTNIATDEEDYVLTTMGNEGTEQPLYETALNVVPRNRTPDKLLSESSSAVQPSGEDLYELPDTYRDIKREAAKKYQVDVGERDVMDDISFALENTDHEPIAKWRTKVSYQMIIAIATLALVGIAFFLIFTLFGVAINRPSYSNTLGEKIPDSWQQVINASHQAILAQQSSQIIGLQAELRELNQEITLLTKYISNPTSSCKYINSSSGIYWIDNSDGEAVRVYCDTMQRSCSCNTTGGWMRVANLDMTDPNQNCPAEFRLVNRTSAPLRTCGRPESAVGCTTVVFPTHNVEYSHVCGKVVSYQYGSPSGFTPYISDNSKTIGSVYVNGISLTHQSSSSARQHIWTFAADTTSPESRYTCPCLDPQLSQNLTRALPAFVNDNYFCDTASQTSSDLFYSDDPLWNGQGCGGTSTCCEFNKPPWFCKQLPQPTTDDIELRLCGSEVADVPIEAIDIYVQ